MRFAVFAFLIAFLIVLAVPASALDGWLYYRPITITNSLSQDLTDYQVNLTLDTAALIYQGKMRSDCGDLRVTLSDGQTLLPYWIENLNGTSTCNTNATKIWTKVSIPASGSTTILLWYGNPSAISAENASAVFLFFDHFNTSTETLTFYGSCTWVRDTANSTIKVTGGSTDCVAVANVSTPNVRVLTRAMIGTANAPFGLNARVLDAGNRLYLYSRADANHLSIAKAVGGSFSEIAYVSFAENTNTWYIFEGLLYNTNVKVTIYNNAYQQLATVNATVSDFSTQTRHGLYSSPSAGSSFDYLIIAQYVSPEPSVDIGNELIGKPDLAIISADYSPKPASVQQQVNISAQIANVGNWTSPIANVTLYINGNAVSTAQISGLNPNASTTVTLAWTPTASGNYTVMIVVDPDNVIDEVNENNNSYNLTIEVLGIADLTVSVALPASGMVGKEVAFSVTVVNIGSATAYNFSIAVYIDTNKIDERRIASLDPNGQILLGYTFTPREARTYTVTAVVDLENNVIESSESNNIANATIKILAFGDIVKIPTPPKPEGKTMKEIYESMTLKTFGLPLEVISLIALLGIAVVGYGFGAFKGTVNLFFLSVLYYIAANALGWSTYIATGLLVVSAILLVIVVAFLKED